VKRFDFESSLQRMSTIVRNSLDRSFRAYVKGSPEMIASLCRPESIPENFEEALDEYTRKGYRVIALGFKVLPGASYLKIQSMKREETESVL